MSFLKRRVSIDSVIPTATVDEEKVREYAQMDARTQPPLEVIDGYVQDGNHRWFASSLRGDKEVDVVDSDLPQEVQSRWSRMFGRKEG